MIHHLNVLVKTNFNTYILRVLTQMYTLIVLSAEVIAIVF